MAYNKSVMNLNQNKTKYGKVPVGVQGQDSLLSRAHPSSKNIPYQQSAYERSSGVDSASFDVTDPQQVLKVQKMLGLKTDGVFGPKTEKAWRDYVNRGRADEGKEGYYYNEVEEPISEPSSGYGSKEANLLGGGNLDDVKIERDIREEELTIKEMEAKRDAGGYDSASEDVDLGMEPDYAPTLDEKGYGGKGLVSSYFRKLWGLDEEE